MARSIVHDMPVTLLTLIDDDKEWKGSPLQDLSESLGIKTPTAREISNNYVFLKPLAMFMPSKATCLQTMKSSSSHFKTSQIPTCSIHSNEFKPFSNISDSQSIQSSSKHLKTFQNISFKRSKHFIFFQHFQVHTFFKQ